MCTYKPSFDSLNLYQNSSETGQLLSSQADPVPIATAHLDTQANTIITHSPFAITPSTTKMFFFPLAPLVPTGSLPTRAEQY